MDKIPHVDYNGKETMPFSPDGLTPSKTSIEEDLQNEVQDDES